jgi:hypothetical protein
VRANLKELYPDVFVCKAGSWEGVGDSAERVSRPLQSLFCPSLKKKFRANETAMMTAPYKNMVSSAATGANRLI